MGKIALFLSRHAITPRLRVNRLSGVLLRTEAGAADLRNIGGERFPGRIHGRRFGYDRRRYNDVSLRC